MREETSEILTVYQENQILKWRKRQVKRRGQWIWSFGCMIAKSTFKLRN